MTTTIRPDTIMQSMSTLPPHTGMVFIDENKGRVVLRWNTLRIPGDVAKILQVAGFRIDSKRKGGGWNLSRPWSNGLHFEVMGKVEGCCKLIPGLLYVTPNRTDYRLRVLPLTAAKVGKTFQVYDNRI